MTAEANDPWDPQPAIAALQEAFDGSAAPPPDRPQTWANPAQP